MHCAVAVICIFSLVSCGLKKEACEVITSVLQSDNSTLKELNLSCNDLRDVGIQVLSQGLCHKNCNLEILRLVDDGGKIIPGRHWIP